jgi:hypothetical protein
VTDGPGTANDQQKARDKKVRGRSRGTSALLVILTSIIGLASIFFLSAILTQTRLSSIAIDGVSLSIWKVAYVGEEWSKLRRHHEAQLAEREKVEQQRGELAEKVTEVEETWRQKWGRVGPLLDLVSLRVKETHPDLTLTDADRAAELIIRILAKHQELLDKYSDLRPTLVSIEAESSSFGAAQNMRDSVRARSKWVLIRISTLIEDVKVTEARLGETFTSIKRDMDDGTRARLENAFYELHSGSLFGLWRALLVTPPDTLTLWLVLLMGILGSSLQCTHAYFKDGRAGTAGSYFLRLSVGALTALIIFIIAKAGVPIVADATRMGGEAAINPYLVSFLAIISGLLSENAIANIQAQGARIFGQSTAPDQNRWARRDLTADLEQRQLTTKALADILGLSEEAMVPMLKGEQPTNSAHQKIIGLALGSNPRDLYTDIPPPEKL